MKAAKLLLILLLIASITAFVNIGSSVTPVKVYIDPIRSDVNVGESFTIFIKVADAINIHALEFRLRWNSSVLNITGYGEGDFLSQEVSKRLSRRSRLTQQLTLGYFTLLALSWELMVSTVRELLPTPLSKQTALE